ncbi:ABC transporter permease [Anaeromicropila populeti]|uniref:Putative ABC transport system permease protein n=1 Tax=Anaeromicropila populeti TaxID=37658 RepID=A0A1I6JC63_9FIRM|nr:ABC transporter permease [Anaeromicropila populeti]SFR76110.1 putative ABC transport system permease protein [Anaeromicropila populeti]
MSSTLLSLLGAASQGLTWAILALGVYITFRILDIPDMSCEGSFALGGSVSAILMVTFHWNPFVTLLIATFAGMVAGLITGFLHSKLKIPAILAGILTMVGLYSVNLRIMGQANTALLGEKTIVSMIQKLLPSAQSLGIKNSVLQMFVTIGIGLLFSGIAIVFLYWFFGTELGCCIRATGNNAAMVRAQGVNTDKMKILGLVLGNALVALSGGLVAQSQGYADIGMGVGAIVIALASIVIGEVIFARASSFAFKLIAIVLGSVIYRLIIAFVLLMGLDANDLKLLTAIVVAVALSIPVIKKTKTFIFIRTVLAKVFSLIGKFVLFSLIAKLVKNMMKGRE